VPSRLAAGRCDCSRKAELGNGRSRELIVPFGGSGQVVLFEIHGDDVVVGAVRHQREEDCRP
jgi:plasmid stabilization system protein ParE